MALVRSRSMSLVPAAPAETGSRVYKFRANDGEFDRYNDRNAVQGWKIDSFNANPVILYNHDDGVGGFFSPPTNALPIGKGKAFVEGNALMCEIEFDDSDPFAQAIERKVSKGILNAVSVRYRLTPGKYQENEKGGIDSDEQELLEISVVTIPGNQRALRVKAFQEQQTLFIDALAAAVAKALTPTPAPAPEPVKSTLPSADALAAAILSRLSLEEK